MKGLKVKIKNYYIKEFNELDSTHKYVKDNIKCLDDKTIVIANKQTDGIGTHGRTWYTGNDKNIAMSILYKPNCNIQKLHTLTIDIANCIKNAIKELYNIELEIKIPNDLLLNNKKICGILTEIHTISENVNYIIISIGFNVNEINFNNEISEKATSLKKEYKKDFDKDEIIQEIIKKLEKEIIENLTSQTNEKLKKY